MPTSTIFSIKTDLTPLKILKLKIFILLISNLSYLVIHQNAGTECVYWRNQQNLNKKFSGGWSCPHKNFRQFKNVVEKRGVTLGNFFAANNVGVGFKIV